MKAMQKRITIGLSILSCCAVAAAASDLTIHLNGSQSIARKIVQYRCDAQGIKMGLPARAFPVEYINGAGNSLAVVPIGGNSLIFANVMSGSGARYAAGQYIWWEAGGSVTISSPSLAGNAQSVCRPVKAP